MGEGGAGARAPFLPPFPIPYLVRGTICYALSYATSALSVKSYSAQSACHGSTWECSFSWTQKQTNITLTKFKTYKHTLRLCGAITKISWDQNWDNQSTLIDFEILVLKTAYQSYQIQLFFLPTVETNYCAQQEVPHYHYQYSTSTTLDIDVDILSIL